MEHAEKKSTKPESTRPDYTKPDKIELNYMETDHTELNYIETAHASQNPIAAWQKELTLEEKASLCSGADFWHTKAVSRLGIPRLRMCDGPSGLRKQKGEGDIHGIGESIPSVCFPSAAAMASSFDRDLLKRQGELLGEICQAEQVGMLLGPGVNIKRSPVCGRNFEYYSEDPCLAGELAAAYIKGLQEKGVAACVKHFACNNQETNRMNGMAYVDERTLYELYLPAFETALKKGEAWALMCAYNGLNGEFCSQNKKFLTHILREQWNYDGCVVTDWGAVKDRVKGLQAGQNLEMPGGSGAQDQKILKAVQTGSLSEEELDASIKEVLKLVWRTVCQKEEASKEGKAQEETKAATDLERIHKEAVLFAEESAVLLKNENQILPLKKERSVAFLGEFAVSPRYQGNGSSHVNPYQVDSAYEAAKEAGRNVVYARGYNKRAEATEKKLLDEAVKLAMQVETAVLFVGLPDFYETEGEDRQHMRMPENQIRLVEEVSQVQPNTVVVLHSGSPVELPWENRVKAILNLYLAGEGAGKATEALLYGEKNPCGKLAETWPLRLEDNPSYLNFPGERGIVRYQEELFVGYRYYDKKKQEVRFPFGYGLSYTQFAYRNLVLEKSQIDDTESLRLHFQVKNAGTRKGKEIVQIYVRKADGAVRRPEQELREFCKVELEPGEEREITLELGSRAFSYYETKLHDWYVEEGTYTIEVAASSRDIRLSEEVWVASTRELPFTYTRYSTIGDLTRSEQGRELVSRLLHSGGSANDVRHLGEGSEKRTQETALAMPLNSLITFGRMTEEQLDAMIAKLNGAK